MPSASDPPRVPVELQDHILSFADPSTLAVACRVSFGLLALASKRLYRHLDLSSIEQAELLFCEIDIATRSPAISPYLSLSQVVSVQWNAPSIAQDTESSPEPEPLHAPTLFLARLPDGPLAIRHMSLVSSSHPHKQVNAAVLELFDPELVHAKGIASTNGSRYVTLSDTWTRVERITLFDAVPSSPLHYHPWAVDGRALRVHYAFSTQCISDVPDILAYFVYDIRGDSDADRPDLSLATSLAAAGGGVVVMAEDPTFKTQLQALWTALLDVNPDDDSSFAAITFEPYVQPTW